MLPATALILAVPSAVLEKNCPGTALGPVACSTIDWSVLDHVLPVVMSNTKPLLNCPIAWNCSAQSVATAIGLGSGQGLSIGVGTGVTPKGAGVGVGTGEPGQIPSETTKGPGAAGVVQLLPTIWP